MPFNKYDSRIKNYMKQKHRIKRCHQVIGCRISAGFPVCNYDNALLRVKFPIRQHADSYSSYLKGVVLLLLRSLS